MSVVSVFKNISVLILAAPEGAAQRRGWERKLINERYTQRVCVCEGSLEAATQTKLHGVRWTDTVILETKPPRNLALRTHGTAIDV